MTPRPDGKVKVYANNFSGTTLNTTALTCADANDMIRDYLAGIPREQPPSAAPSRASSARQKATNPNGRVSYQPAKRHNDNYVAGPGRGNRDRVKAVQNAKQILQDDIDQVLDEHDDASDSLTPEADASWSELHTHINSIGSTDMSQKCRQIIKEQQKKQKHSGKSKRTLRKVKAQIKDEVRNYELDDKIEILESVLSSLSKKHKKRKRQASVTDQIIESIQHCVSVLREKRPDQIKKGRMKHNDRVSLQNILISSTCKVPSGKVLWVQKLEGVGSTFTLTDKEFPVFVEDIRLSKFKMERMKTRASQRASHAKGIERFQLPSITKASIIGSMPMTLDKETKSHVRTTYHNAK